MVRIQGNVVMLEETDPIVPQPDAITIHMFDHQLRVVKRAIDLEQGIINYDLRIDSNVGILCDSVGAGKSYEALAILAQPSYKDSVFLSMEGGLIARRQVECINTSVIIVPHSLINQWKSYLDNTTFDYAVVRTDKTEYEYKEIMLVSNTAHRKFAIMAAEHNVCFKRVVYDECDTIRLPNCDRLDSMFYWFISASISNIHCYYKYIKIGSRGFIKDTFIMINTSRYSDHLFIKNDDSVVEQTMVIPDMLIHNIPCASRNGTILQGAVNRSILDMLQAGNTRGAIDTFGANTTTEDNLIKIVCEDMFHKLETRKEELESVMTREYATPDYKLVVIDRVKGYIKDIETSIENIRERMSENDVCPISYCDIEIPAIVKCCQHRFDFESLTSYMSTQYDPKCPFCRTPITSDSIIVVDDAAVEPNIDDVVEYEYKNHTAIENTIYILNMMPEGARILIFSSYDETFDLIDSANNGTVFKQLKGNNMVQNCTLKWFNERDDLRKAILLNSLHIGAGVNLQMADYIILAHKMDQEMQRQCIGRAQRFGRVGQLTVYKFSY